MAASEPKLILENRVVSLQRDPSTDSPERPLPARQVWSVPLLLHDGAACHQIAPITMALPFPQALVVDQGTLVLFDESEKEVVLQSQVLARWPDFSVQWLVLDFLVKVIAPEKSRWLIRERPEKPPVDADSNLHVYETEEGIRVATGAATFCLSQKSFPPFENVFVGGRDMLDTSKSPQVLADVLHWPKGTPIGQVVLEEKGPVRATLRFEAKSSDAVLGKWCARLCFFARTSIVKCRVFWDGRPGLPPVWLNLAREGQAEGNTRPWDYQPARMFAPLQWYANSGAIAESDLARDNPMDRLGNILAEVADGMYNPGPSKGEAAKKVGPFHALRNVSWRVGARLAHFNRYFWSNVIWRS